MRRALEQLLVDSVELLGMFIEALVFGVPLAVSEVADVLKPATIELLLIGGLLWILFW